MIFDLAVTHWTLRNEVGGILRRLSELKKCKLNSQEIDYQGGAFCLDTGFEDYSSLVLVAHCRVTATILKLKMDFFRVVESLENQVFINNEVSPDGRLLFRSLP
jgi:hypothetical protein